MSFPKVTIAQKIYVYDYVSGNMIPCIVEDHPFVDELGEYTLEGTKLVEVWTPMLGDDTVFVEYYEGMFRFLDGFASS